MLQKQVKGGKAPAKGKKGAAAGAAAAASKKEDEREETLQAVVSEALDR